jgi:hypothetical protein
MRWLFLIALLLGCPGNDTADDTASPSTAAPSTTTMTSVTGDTGNDSSSGAVSTTTQAPGTSSSGDPDTSATSEPTTSGLDASSSGGQDCNAPSDCTECWNCAAQGPCMAMYQSCQMMAFCIPTLACLESMCLANGLLQECADTCCMSCTDLGTCPMVDTAISCIEQECAGLCGQISCP